MVGGARTLVVFSTKKKSLIVFVSTLRGAVQKNRTFLADMSAKAFKKTKTQISPPPLEDM